MTLSTGVDRVCVTLDFGQAAARPGGGASGHAPQTERTARRPGHKPLVYPCAPQIRPWRRQALSARLWVGFPPLMTQRLLCKT